MACGRDLASAEDRPARHTRCLVEDAPVRRQYLSEPRAGAAEARSAGVRESRVGLVDQSPHVAGTRTQALVQGLVEALLEAGVDERTQSRQQQSHRYCERKRELEAQGRVTTYRHSHHAVRRYPPPRTVSMLRRPNGRSIFSRRRRM